MSVYVIKWISMLFAFTPHSSVLCYRLAVCCLLLAVFLTF